MRCRLRGHTGRAVPLVCVLSISSGLAACSSTDQTGQKEAQGTLVGSVVGGMIGGYIPGGNSVAGQVLRSQAGTIGSLVGGAIGAALDEEDRQRLAQATRAAIAGGQPKSFSNKQSGVRGKVTVTRSHVNDSGQQCRTVKQEVIVKDGTTLSDTVSACKGPNGWDV